MNKNIIISHKSDIDGRLGRELFCHLADLPTDTPTLWIEYGADEKQIRETASEWARDKDVFILDFAVSQDFFDTVAKYANNVQLFDHHTGSTEIIGTTIVDTDESTVSLLWNAFGMGEQPKLIQIAKGIDLDMIHNPSLLKHKLFLDSIFMENRADKQEQMLKLLKDYVLPIKFLHKEQEMYSRIKSLAFSKKNIILKGKKIGYVLREEKDKDLETDVIANLILNQDNTLDFAIVCFYISKVGYIYSVRKFRGMTSSLEKFVGSYGGGGRETAGAFRLEMPLSEITI
jgi:oligoribonuclease NrnB/cAMP/cGMP phosphodiesterase (DHH superfamily)